MIKALKVKKISEIKFESSLIYEIGFRIKVIINNEHNVDEYCHLYETFFEITELRYDYDKDRQDFKYVYIAKELIIYKPLKEIKNLHIKKFSIDILSSKDIKLVNTVYGKVYY